MAALQLIIWTAFFAFAAGWLYARDERVFAGGTLAIGIGGSMAQNPFPTELDIFGYDIYGEVGVTLFFGGMVILLGWGIVQYSQRSVPQSTEG